MRYLLPSIISIYILSSCATTNYLTIDIRQPAIVSFPPEVTNVVIVDNSPTMNTEEDEEADAGRAAILSTDSARTILLNSLQKFMSEEKYFNQVELYPYKTYNGQGDNMTPLPARKVQAISHEKDADALISLDLFAISAQLETENITYFSSYSVLLGTKLGAIVRVYAKDGSQYSQPIGLVDSLFRQEATDWINSLVAEIATVGADKLTGYFIPSWKPTDRWYYSDNSSGMKEAAKYAAQGKWQEAAEIWGALYDDSKPSKKIRIASNIALANECLDDIENAAKWIEQAYELLPVKSRSEVALQVAAYRIDLKTRAANAARLNQQLGVEDTEGEEPVE